MRSDLPAVQLLYAREGAQTSRRFPDEVAGYIVTEFIGYDPK